MLDTFRRPAPLPTAVAPAVRPPMAVDLDALGINLLACRACQGRWFTLACAAEAAQRFLAPRVITTLVAAMALWAAVGALA